MGFTTITITGTFHRPNGEAAQGTVTATPSAAMRNGAESLAATPVLGVLSNEGKLVAQSGAAFTLKATDDAETIPAGMVYEFVAQIDNQPVREFAAVVPHAATGGTVTLAELEALAVPALPAGIPLSQRGGPNGVATLEGAGLVPTSQLPAGVQNNIPLSQKGAANGVGTLDAEGHQPASQGLRPVLYNPKGLRRFRAKAGDALYTTVPIVCVGDSIVAGQGGDNSTGTFNNVPDNTQGWVGQLRTLLSKSPQSGVAEPGEEFIFSNDSRITNEGGVANNWPQMPLRNGFRLIGNAQKLKLTVPAGVTRISVVQGNGTTDVTAKYKLGAGAETNLSALTNTGVPLESTAIVVAEGEELVILGPATERAYIVGLTLKTSTATGFAVHRIGKPGYVSGDLLGGQSEGTLLQSASEANQKTAARACYDWAGATGLVIVSFGTNDQSYQLLSSGGTANQKGVTLAKYETWMKQFIAQVVEDGWCVLVLGEPRNPTSEATGEGTHSMDEYWAAMKTYALASEHVAFLDVGELWGTHAEAEALGLTAASTVHPLRPGHGDIARMVYRAILGNAHLGTAALGAA